MQKAVENYAGYRQSPEAWMLGRFVVPVARLDEFEACAGSAEGWRLSVLAGGDLASDVTRIAQSGVAIDTIEIKASDAGQIEAAIHRLPPSLTPYFEISDPALIPSVRSAGARAKIRTGGVTPDAFPEARQIARFLDVCAKTSTAFKATAGLHHPLRSYRPLTYSKDGPSGWMYGFLNVFLAAVLARRGLKALTLESLLIEESPDAFSFTDDSIAWSGETAPTSEIVATRQDFAISFGSCSFEEPVADLSALKLI
jgi:hypothetical protein